MKKVMLRPIDRQPSIETNQRILDALLAEQVDVMMACGGRGRCATCHVFVEEGMDQLSPAENREIRTLNRLSNRGGNSRLACQARVQGQGVRVRLPEGMYIQDTQELTSLIGQRADDNYRHPITGETLIEKGKLITRFAIMELDDVDLDFDIRADDFDNTGRK